MINKILFSCTCSLFFLFNSYSPVMSTEELKEVVTSHLRMSWSKDTLEAGATRRTCIIESLAITSDAVKDAEAVQSAYETLIEHRSVGFMSRPLSTILLQTRLTAKLAEALTKAAAPFQIAGENIKVYQIPSRTIKNKSKREAINLSIEKACQAQGWSFNGT